MSRGLGSVQRQILSAMSEGPDTTRSQYVTVNDLAARLHGAPTRAQLVALRRALHRLAQLGRLKLSVVSLRPHEQLAVYLPDWAGPVGLRGEPEVTAPRKRCSDTLGQRKATLREGTR